MKFFRHMYCLIALQVSGNPYINFTWEILEDVFGNRSFFLFGQNAVDRQQLQAYVAKAQEEKTGKIRGSGDPTWRAPSQEVLETVQLSNEDHAASTDCVLIAAYANADDEPGSIIKPYCNCAGHLDEDHREAPLEDPTRAIAIFGLNVADEGVFCTDDGERFYNTKLDNTFAFYITFSAYCIFQTAAPGLSSTDLYRFYAENCLNYSQTTIRKPEPEMPCFISYGPVGKFHYYDGSRMDICQDEHDPERWWLELLCDGKRSDSEIVEEAWQGQGNLWVFRRPDRFPISRTVDAPPLSQFDAQSVLGVSLENLSLAPHFCGLGLDVLSLICEYLPLKTFMHVLSLNRGVRETLLCHVNSISYRALKNVEPWYLPARPIKTPDGTREREELDLWEKQWFDESNFAPEDIRQRAPWMKYWIQCTRDWSMRNRKRIWGISEQIKASIEDCRDADG